MFGPLNANLSFIDIKFKLFSVTLKFDGFLGIRQYKKADSLCIIKTVVHSFKIFIVTINTTQISSCHYNQDFVWNNIIK